MKTTILFSSLLLAGLSLAPMTLPAQTALIAQAQAAAQSTPDPARQVTELVQLLRTNNLTALVQAMVPPLHYQQLRDKHELRRLQPVTAEQRAEFAEGIAKLIDPDAVDTLMAEIEPKLTKHAVQSEGMILMGLGALNIAATSPDSDLSDSQRAAIRSALPGLERWIIATDFFSVESMRNALTVLSDGARSTGIRDLDQLMSLSLEQTLDRASTMLGSVKQALLIYGIDVDAIAATTRVEVLEIAGDSARIRTTVTVFDAPIASEQDLVLIEGRWYSKDAVQGWERELSREDEDLAQVEG
ncbi:hypothetical protein [Aquimonas sp.]|jgi:hypothetical protein|uniref:hypothetical protein n=1 Tax=Aquimonas sp. TaxID=1872588 RepID=UPI0037C1208D